MTCAFVNSDGEKAILEAWITSIEPLGQEDLDELSTFTPNIGATCRFRPTPCRSAAVVPSR